MPYFKHPSFGNRHATDAEAAALEAAGWTRFPRSKEAKAAGPWPPAVQPAPLAVETPVSIESVRAQLDAAGITYDKRLGLAKLQALLPQ